MGEHTKRVGESRGSHYEAPQADQDAHEVNPDRENDFGCQAFRSLRDG